METQYYNYYVTLITSKKLSLEGLKRIITHDETSGWSKTVNGLIRLQILDDCLKEKYSYKELDEETDILFGITWPLPYEDNINCNLFCNSHEITYTKSQENNTTLNEELIRHISQHIVLSSVVTEPSSVSNRKPRKMDSQTEARLETFLKEFACLTDELEKCH